MSELRSLFVKLKIKKENLERFLEAEITTPEVDGDWTAWWDSREMYSKAPLKEIPTESEDTNGEVFESYIDTDETLSLEKHEEGVYYFASGMFGENYYEILPMLAVLKSAALYMEAGDEGEAFVYDYFWGGKNVLAHLVLKPGKAVLKDTKKIDKINKDLVAEAGKMMQEALKKMTGK
jgi:hypothetical protein